MANNRQQSQSSHCDKKNPLRMKKDVLDLNLEGLQFPCRVPANSSSQNFSLLTYLPTFGNQKSGNFHPPTRHRPKLEEEEDWSTEIHEPIIHTVQIDKWNFYFFSICSKKTRKIWFMSLKTSLKTGIFTGWNSWKSGRPDFWRFRKSKIGTVPIKSGRLAGMFQVIVLLERCFQFSVCNSINRHRIVIPTNL